jgi:hypothetical protein
MFRRTKSTLIGANKDSAFCSGGLWPSLTVGPVRAEHWRTEAEMDYEHEQEQGTACFARRLTTDTLQLLMRSGIDIADAGD